MGDTYQAVYDAIRSKFHMPDIGEIIRNAFDISWQVDAVKTEFLNAAYEMQRPSVIFKAQLFNTGEVWTAVYGNDIVGMGKSRSEAMYDFDKNWREKLP